MPSNYTYNIAGHYANDERPLTAQSPADEIFNGLSPEKRRQVCDEAWQTEENKRSTEETIRNGRAFQDNHPEYVACKDNLALLAGYFEARGRDIIHGAISYYEMEEAYNHFRSRGLLILDENVLRKQEAAAIRAKAEQFGKDQVFNEADADTMPMSDLRMLADAQLRRGSGIR